MALSATDRDTMLRVVRDSSLSVYDKRQLSEALGAAFSLTTDDKRAAYDHLVPKR